MDTSKEVSACSFKQCGSETDNANFRIGFGACLDVALALYPFLIFWSLKLQLHVKIGLMALFGFGVV